MLDPEYLLRISEGSEQIASELHEYIVTRIVEGIIHRMGRGDDYILTARDKWMIEVLKDAGYLLEDIKKEIARKTRLQEKEIKAAMENAGVTALEYDDKIYQAAGLSPTPLKQSPHMIRLMQRNYEATLGEWKNFTRTTAVASQRTFINAVDKAYHLTASGAVSYTSAVKEAVNEIAGNGVEVVYPSGRKDTIEVATLRAVRTGISQATAQIQLARMKEMGVSLCITSSHLGARPSHAEWQGQVFSIDWNRMNAIYPLPEIPTPESVNTELQKKYPDFIDSTGFGTVTGLSGVNCRHSFGSYFEGQPNPYEKFDTEENRKAYELSQKQRSMERRIRKTKREVMAWKAAVDNATDEKLRYENDLEYQKKAALLRKQNKAYRDFCKENDLKPLQDRLNVAKWNREQSSTANGAATRYENALGSGKSKDSPSSEKKFIGTMDYDKAPEAISYYNSQIKNEKIENAVVIDKSGNVYQFTGNENSVNIFDTDLNGAYITHNHPVSEGIVSFGEDDFNFLRENQFIKQFGCCNEEYEYSLKILQDISKVSYNEIYLEGFKYANTPEFEAQDAAMRVLADRGYVKYDKRKFK